MAEPSSSGILRELLIRLGLDIDEAKFAKGQIAASVLTAAVFKAADTARELAAAFVENIHSTVQYGDRINKMSQEVGVNAEALQAMGHAGEMAGIDLNTMGNAMGFLARTMDQAKRGSEESAKALKGIPFKTASGELMAVDEVMVSVADRFRDMPDGAQKTALAMQLFGRAGKQLIPALNKGSEELRTMRQEAEEMGLIISGDAAKASEELEDNIHRLSDVTKGLWRQAIVPILPALNKLVLAFLRWKKENGETIKSMITGSVNTLIKALMIAVHVIDALVKNAKALTVIIGAAGLTAAFHRFSVAAVQSAIQVAKAWALAAAPFLVIGGILAALFLIFDDLRGYAEGEESAFGDLEAWAKRQKENNPFNEWLDVLIAMIEMIKDAIKFWTHFSDSVKSGWQDIKDTFGDFFSGRSRNTFTEEQLQARLQERNARVIGEARASTTTNNSPTSVNANFSIYQQPGESTADLANRVNEHLQQSMYPAALQSVQGAK